MEGTDDGMIYSADGFQGSSIEDMSILYSPSFDKPDGKLGSNQDVAELNLQHYHQPLDNSGLLRYRSAPSSFLESLVNTMDSHSGAGGNVRAIGAEDYCYFGSLNAEMNSMMPRFRPTYNGSGNSSPHNLREFEERSVVKQEAVDSEMAYQNFRHDMANGNSVGGRFDVMSAIALDNSTESTKMNTTDGSNLIRQNSSPAGTFPNLSFDDGFSRMRAFGSLTAGRESKVETGRSVMNQVNFLSSPKLLPQIAEIGCESFEANGPDDRISKRQFLPCFGNDAWDDTASDDHKGNVPDRSMFSQLNTLVDQNGNPGDRILGLTHHASLPKSVAEVATMEKFLRFQGATPCKFRAKRGHATHPRSIAERVRRTRISERMKKLQDLFPNMDKQTNTADMLDIVVEHIKDLQKQVETLKDTKANCICSNKRQQYPTLA